jgi:starvation-inducible outer membrane lipoprotein
MIMKKIDIDKNLEGENPFISIHAYLEKQTEEIRKEGARLRGKVISIEKARKSRSPEDRTG